MVVLKFRKFCPTHPTCKGKSFINCLVLKAFALTGRQVCVHNNPGRCSGLGASALSGRAASGTFGHSGHAASGTLGHSGHAVSRTFGHSART